MIEAYKFSDEDVVVEKGRGVAQLHITAAGKCVACNVSTVHKPFYIRTVNEETRRSVSIDAPTLLLSIVSPVRIWFVISLAAVMA